MTREHTIDIVRSTGRWRENLAQGHERLVEGEGINSEEGMIREMEIVNKYQAKG